MKHERFDDWTRQLGSGHMSRRHIIKLLAAGIVGGVAAGRGSAMDALAHGNNSACAKFCTSVFGGDTAAQSQCASDGAHGVGLCYTCGPYSEGGGVPPSLIYCGPRNASGYCESYSFAFCSCFIGTTMITMADGTSRPIERLQIGDLVIGSEGQVNRVVDVERPLLGDRALYALNGGDFFVTAEHPFLTADGWKSIDPERLAAEGSDLPVNRLAVGDRLVHLTGVALAVGASGSAGGEGVDIRTDAVSLDSLVGRSADPTTPLYNLRLDGNHSYFANGLLVHNK